MPYQIVTILGNTITFCPGDNGTSHYIQGLYLDSKILLPNLLLSLSSLPLSFLLNALLYPNFVSFVFFAALRDMMPFDL
jgi:hypothetical protein